MLPLLLSSDEIPAFRPDPSMLSDQARLELLFASVTPKTFMLNEHGEPADLLSWSGAEVRKNALQRLILSRSSLKGSIDLAWMPKLLGFDVGENSLTGTLNLEALPDCLTLLYLNHNKISGSAVLTALPRRLHLLRLDHNALTGSIVLRALPQQMTHLSLNSNMLTGTVDVSQLPPPMTCLQLESNSLSGEVRMRWAQQTFARCGGNPDLKVVVEN